MKALLLAAGLGTRMKPFTFFRAKPSLPLLNAPFLHYPLQYLYSQNVKEAVVNLHSHPETVRSAAAQFSHPIDIQFSMEPQILGTAGAIRQAFGRDQTEPILVMNADMLMNISLEQMMQQHIRSNADVTLAIMEGQKFDRYGGLYFEPEGEEEGPLRFKGIREGKGKKFHYTGLQILNGDVIQDIPPDRKSDTFTDIYVPLSEQKRIYGFVYDDFWLEIGNPREYLKTSLYLLENPLPASLQPPLMEATLISRRATLEEDAVVSESIIMEGARIKSGIHVERSIIGWDVTVTKSVKDVSLAKGTLPWPIEGK
jgi:mannose-1-phosphate guanylyltransferase